MLKFPTMVIEDLNFPTEDYLQIQSCGDMITFMSHVEEEVKEFCIAISNEQAYKLANQILKWVNHEQD